MTGDRVPDLVWYHTTARKVAVWVMDTQFQRVSAFFTTPAEGQPDWRLEAVADYGRAGGPGNTSDLVWRHSVDGTIAVWHVNWSGQRVAGAFTSPSSVSLDWKLVGPVRH